MTDLSNTVVDHPAPSIGVKEPHRVVVVQDWGARVQPLYDQYDATRLAFEEATASGLLDRPVDVQVLEHEGLPYGQASTLERRVERLIADFDPIVLIGHHTSHNLPALRPAIERWAIPTVAMTGSMVAPSPWIFVTPNGTFSDEAILMVDHCVEIFEGRRLGIIRKDNELGDEYTQWVRRRAGQRRLPIAGDIVLGSFITDEEADAAFRTLEAAGADCVVCVCVGFGATARAVLGGSQRARAGGYRPHLITMSIFMKTIPGLAKLGEREYRGLLAGYEGWTGVDQFDEDNPHFAALLDRFEARYDGRRPKHCYVAQGYDMGNVVAHGLALAKPLCRDGLRRSLEQVRRVPATAGGPGNHISFGPYDHRGYKGEYIVMRKIEGGENIVAPKVTLSRV